MTIKNPSRERVQAVLANASAQESKSVLPKAGFARTTIDLPKELKRSLRSAAGWQGVTMRDVIVEACREWMERQKKQGTLPRF